VTPSLVCGARKLDFVRDGGFRDVRDLSRLREGEEARREAREWVEGAVWEDQFELGLGWRWGMDVGIGRYICWISLAWLSLPCWWR
jgi:hypothetical protein